MVVIFIVGILAAAAIPILRGRVDSAKWSEGMAGAGSIRTAARAFCGEKGESWDYSAGVSLTQLGFNITPAAESGDLDGKYFSDEAYAIAFTAYNTYTVTVTPANSVNRPNGPSTPASVTLDQDGAWTENP